MHIGNIINNVVGLVGVRSSRARSTGPSSSPLGELTFAIAFSNEAMQ